MPKPIAPLVETELNHHVGAADLTSALAVTPGESFPEVLAGMEKRRSAAGAPTP